MIGAKVTLRADRETQTISAGGSPILTWEPLRNIKGSLITVKGEEQWSADKKTVFKTHCFFCSRTPALTITEKDRFVWAAQNKEFDIVYIDKPMQKNRMIKFDLTERT